MAAAAGGEFLFDSWALRNAEASSCSSHCTDTKMREDPWPLGLGDEDDEELFAFASAETDFSLATSASHVISLQEQLKQRDEELHAERQKVADLQTRLHECAVAGTAEKDLELEMLRVQEQLEDRDRQLEAERMRSMVLKQTLKNLTVERKAYEKALLDLEAERMKADALKQSVNDLAVKERALQQTALDLEVVTWELENERVRNRLLEGEMSLLRKEAVSQYGTGVIMPLDLGKLRAAAQPVTAVADIETKAMSPDNLPELSLRKLLREKEQRVELLERTLSEVLSCLDDERQKVGVGRIKAWCLKKCLRDARLPDLLASAACAEE